MLLCLYAHISITCFKCLICFQTCCKCFIWISQNRSGCCTAWTVAGGQWPVVAVCCCCWGVAVGFPVRAQGGRGGAGPATDVGVESGRDAGGEPGSVFGRPRGRPSDIFMWSETLVDRAWKVLWAIESFDQLKSQVRIQRCKRARFKQS
jgi:hypothetical protein